MLFRLRFAMFLLASTVMSVKADDSALKCYLQDQLVSVSEDQVCEYGFKYTMGTSCTNTTIEKPTVARVQSKYRESLVVRIRDAGKRIYSGTCQCRTDGCNKEDQFTNCVVEAIKEQLYDIEMSKDDKDRFVQCITGKKIAEIQMVGRPTEAAATTTEIYAAKIPTSTAANKKGWLETRANEVVFALTVLTLVFWIMFAVMATCYFLELRKNASTTSAPIPSKPRRKSKSILRPRPRPARRAPKTPSTSKEDKKATTEEAPAAEPDVATPPTYKQTTDKTEKSFSRSPVADTQRPSPSRASTVSTKDPSLFRDKRFHSVKNHQKY